MTVLFLCVFALFHHVLPRWRPQVGEAVKPVPIGAAVQEPTPEPQPADTAEPVESTPEETPEEASSDLPSEPPAQETEAPLTWREQFSSFFTDEIQTSPNSYSSPNVSVRIEYREERIGGIPQHCYYADVYIADIRCLRTAPAYNGFTVYSAESALNLARRTEAIAAINGDYCNIQRDELLVRNGNLYFSEPTVCDVCVLYEDGVMETYAGGSYDVDEIMARLPYQIWRFGPALLDENGKANTSFENTAVMMNRHPRTGIGYFEPGHYCFVVFEGRFNDAGGLSMEEFAAFFESLGCRSAYNLDGGASSVMTFGGAICNRQSSNRDLGDIIYVCEPEAPWPEDP